MDENGGEEESLTATINNEVHNLQFQPEDYVESCEQNESPAVIPILEEEDFS